MVQNEREAFNVPDFRGGKKKEKEKKRKIRIIRCYLLWMNPSTLRFAPPSSAAASLNHVLELKGFNGTCSAFLGLQVRTPDESWTSLGTQDRGPLGPLWSLLLLCIMLHSLFPHGVRG